MALGVIDVVPRMQPPAVIHENDAPLGQLVSNEVQRRPGLDLCTPQRALQLVERSRRLAAQRREDVPPEPHNSGPRTLLPPPATAGSTTTTGISAQQDASQDVLLGWGGPRGWREEGAQPVDVHDGQGAPAVAVVLEDLEREVSWRGVLVAAVGVPGELVHGLGTGLVVACLEGRLVRPDVPEPATLGAVGYGQLVSMMVMETAEEMLEVCARCVCELETDFEDAVVLQLVMDLIDMVRLAGVD
ncbi:unnamed protein product, partial [Clonostachys solani]